MNKVGMQIRPEQLSTAIIQSVPGFLLDSREKIDLYDE